MLFAVQGPLGHRNIILDRGPNPPGGSLVDMHSRGMPILQNVFGLLFWLVLLSNLLSRRSTILDCDAKMQKHDFLETEQFSKL